MHPKLPIFPIQSEIEMFSMHDPEVKILTGAMLVFQSMVQLQEFAAKKVSGCLSSSQSAFDV